MQIRSYSWTSSHVYNGYLGIYKHTHELIMDNPIKRWFFDLIEDAIGSKAMSQFKKEEKEAKENSKSNNERKRN
tara:strand:+ start:420 stop:641 length:222 start_codon:yes stop_codon:yes gene_type:complete